MNATNNEASTETEPTMRLERETCSRCCGTGHYSYCQMHGTMCFKCGGKKVVLTKRGAAAARYLETLRSKRAGDLVVGDVVWADGIPGYTRGRFVKITAIAPSTVRFKIGDGEWQTSTGLDISPVVSGIAADALVRVAQSAAEKEETLRRAIAYQATLTKSGTPRKRCK